MNRVEWLMHRANGTCKLLLPDRDDKSGPSDPAQTILLVLAVFYSNEVEEAFGRLADGEVDKTKNQEPRTMCATSLPLLEPLPSLLSR
jgi:hypothetical protein